MLALLIPLSAQNHISPSRNPQQVIINVDDNGRYDNNSQPDSVKVVCWSPENNLMKIGYTQQGRYFFNSTIWRPGQVQVRASYPNRFYDDKNIPIGRYEPRDENITPLSKCADVRTILVIDQTYSHNADSLIKIGIRQGYEICKTHELPSSLELENYDVVIDFDGSRLYGESFMSDEVLQEHFDLLYQYAENGGKIINFGDFRNDDYWDIFSCWDTFFLGINSVMNGFINNPITGGMSIAYNEPAPHDDYMPYSGWSTTIFEPMPFRQGTRAMAIEAGETGRFDWYPGFGFAYFTDEGQNTRAEMLNAILANLFYTVDAPEQPLPQEYSLSQNYPNPFNAKTNISFALPEETEVSIRIYNITGQLVETLSPGLLPAGNHNVTWDANDAASGVYFYTIDTGAFTETKQMTLLR